MNWLREILQAKGIEVTDELIADVQKEAARHVIPKTEFNLKLDEISGLRRLQPRYNQTMFWGKIKTPETQ